MGDSNCISTPSCNLLSSWSNNCNLNFKELRRVISKSSQSEKNATTLTMARARVRDALELDLFCHRFLVLPFLLLLEFVFFKSGTCFETSAQICALLKSLLLVPLMYLLSSYILMTQSAFWSVAKVSADLHSQLLDLRLLLTSVTSTISQRSSETALLATLSTGIHILSATLLKLLRAMMDPRSTACFGSMTALPTANIPIEL